MLDCFELRCERGLMCLVHLPSGCKLAFNGVFSGESLALAQAYLLRVAQVFEQRE